MKYKIVVTQPVTDIYHVMIYRRKWLFFWTPFKNIGMSALGIYTITDAFDRVLGIVANWGIDSNDCIFILK